MPDHQHPPLLDGLRVLDFSRHVSGPYGTMLLADLGADVIKVESLTGDPQRALSPRLSDLSVLFASLNRNKRSIAVDLRSTQGKTVLRRLAAGTDVICHNFRPGVLDAAGLSFEDARVANPAVVYASLTGYGLDGPRRDAPAYDLALQALSGGMSLTGHPGDDPVRAGIPIADLCGGMMASLAITSALARGSGEAIQLDCSLFDTQISMLAYWAGIFLNTREVPGPQASGNSNIVPYGAVRAADGHFVIAPYRQSFWIKLCEAMELTNLLADPRFVTNDDRIAHRDELEKLLAPEFARRTVAKWLAILEEHDVPCAPVQGVDAALNDPQVAAREMRIRTPRDGVGWEFAGNPIKTRPSRPTPEGPPPLLGEHTDEVLAEAGYAEDEIQRLRAESVVA